MTIYLLHDDSGGDAMTDHEVRTRLDQEGHNWIERLKAEDSARSARVAAREAAAMTALWVICAAAGLGLIILGVWMWP